MREFELLEHVYEGNPALPGHVVIPPGDDMALLRLDGTHLLAAVDQLVAGVHFDPARTDVALVGRKAITRCLSDVAAMAGRPRAALVAATLPDDYGTERALALFDAMRSVAETHGCPLVGGDVAVHRAAGPLVCAVTVLADVGDRAVTRAGAQAGDTLFVTGALGGACDPPESGRHLTFEPRIDAALELVAALRDDLHAMIDLSDGLGRDAGHLAEQSGVQILIDAAAVPCRGDLDWRRAMGDGEDYELCFAARGAVPETLAGVPVTAVGTVTDPGRHGGALVVVRDGDTIVDGGTLGWQHES